MELPPPDWVFRIGERVGRGEVEDELDEVVAEGEADDQQEHRHQRGEIRREPRDAFRQGLGRPRHPIAPDGAGTF